MIWPQTSRVCLTVMLLIPIAACTRSNDAPPAKVSSSEPKVPSPAAATESTNSSEANAESAETRITKILAHQLGIDPSQVDLDEPLMKRMDGDELAMINLIKTIEKEFSIKVPFDAITMPAGNRRPYRDNLCGRDFIMIIEESIPPKN